MAKKINKGTDKKTGELENKKSSGRVSGKTKPVTKTRNQKGRSGIDPDIQIQDTHTSGSTKKVARPSGSKNTPGVQDRSGKKRSPVVKSKPHTQTHSHTPKKSNSPAKYKVKELSSDLHVYVLPVPTGGKVYWDFTDQEFKNAANKNGQVYTLKQFEKQFNEWTVSHTQDVIRIM